MKSNRQTFFLPRRRAPTGARWPRGAHRHQDRLGRHHGREQRHERADPEREREPLHVGRREHEQDERGHDRDHVRVDDRRQALAVAGRDPLPDRAPAADLLLDALENHDVGVGGDADREDQTSDPGQSQRHRDQLDQRVEVERVGHQAGGRDHAQHAVVGEQEQHHIAKPTPPASRPSWSACLPSDADTCDLEISLRLIGSAPSRSSLARSLAEVGGEVAADLGAGVAGDPVRILLEVDLGDRDQLRVERDGEVLVERLRVADEGTHLRAAPRDRAGDALELVLALRGEAEVDVRGPGRIGALLGVRDVVAEQRDVVLEHEELRRRVRDLRRLREVGGIAWITTVPCGTVSTCPCGLGDAQRGSPCCRGPGGSCPGRRGSSAGPAPACSRSTCPRSRRPRCRAHRTSSTAGRRGRCSSATTGCLEASLTAS